MLNQIEKKTKHHSVSLIPQAFVDTTYPELSWRPSESTQLTSEMVMDCPLLVKIPAIATVSVKTSKSYVSKPSALPELVTNVSASYVRGVLGTHTYETPKNRIKKKGTNKSEIRTKRRRESQRSSVQAGEVPFFGLGAQRDTRLLWR